MLDIKWIRENPAALDNALAKRNAEPRSSAVLLADQKRRDHITRMQEARERRNVASNEIRKAMVVSDVTRVEELKTEVSKLNSWLIKAQDEGRQLNNALEGILSCLPNIPLEDIPVGNDENDNVEIRKIGTPRIFDFTPKEHYELGAQLGEMDFEQAARISGARFSILFDELAHLERAIGQFMIDMHTQEHGYREVSPPLLVRDDAIYGTAQLPKFAEDLFRTTAGHWLIPTAEVPLTNLVREKILNADVLPLRFTAFTPCFRSEVGSAGRDTHGILRQHQFWKVEMVSITSADSALDELERMTRCAEKILERLELPFRTVVLCTADMGFSARKTYDIEVWMPGQGGYREISSCSVCGDFQARRINTRYRRTGEKALKFVHTLNGSGTAVGRCLIAIMENYQLADGQIAIPKALQTYMGGLKSIEPRIKNMRY
ncbi:MAG: seryl-tRNA synthetase [Candidatus Tokpelaia sp. JSC188]|nr:MAG: seryl-tRNA synthetase [Candidatus Tokpelaia sp. JSC188]